MVSQQTSTDDVLSIDGDLNGDGIADVTITGDALGNDIVSNTITDVTASRTASVLSDNSRIFNHSYYGGSLTVTGLTLTGGRAGDSYGGGAIRTAGALTVEDSVIAGNSSSADDARGGGIRTQGTLTITDSTVSGNVAGTNTGTGGNTSKGGGAYAGGAVTVTGSTIADNRTVGFAGDGGGIASFNGATITDSAISGNSTVGGYADGGGLYILGTLTLTNSTVSGNSTSGDTNAQGGGIFSATTTIVGSTISNNSTTGTVARGGGIYTTSTLTMLNSTVSGNSTANIEAGGGGIWGSGTVNLTNVTVSGNSTDGANSDGGGVRATNLNLFNSTISGNSTAAADATGGGVYASALDTTNSIILGNETSFAGTDNDEVHTSSSTDFFGHNIIGADTAAFDDSVSAYVSNADPTAVFAATVANGGALAGVLAGNGGTVETIALKGDLTNPALDRGTANLASDANDLDNDGDTGEQIPVDARGPGFVRDVAVSIGGSGSHKDLGAFDLQPANPSLVVNTALDEVNAFDGLISLREAVDYVNGGLLSGPITFDAAVFNGEPGDIIRLTQGEIEITTAMTIDGDVNGDGTPDVVISGDANGDDNTDADGLTILHTGFVPNLTDNSRLFLISAPNTHTELNGLILTGGHTQNGGVYYRGGAIQTAANLTITDSILAGNSTYSYSARGGAIAANGATELIIRNSLIDNNGTFTSSGGGDGGGIFSYGDVSVYDSTVSNNFVLGSGADGAGINSRGDLLVVRSTISGNNNKGSGGGDGGGLYGHYAGSLTIVNSTISDNFVQQSGGQGGGVAAKSDLLIVNSTFSGNRTFGSSGHGGALYIYDNSGVDENARIYNSTFSGNSVYGSNTEAGGIWVRDSPLFITNSIILGNYARYGLAGDQEVFNSSTSFYFQGENIVGQMPYAFNAAPYTNVENGNPFLVFDELEVNGFWLAGKLADNGGPVQTIALRETINNPAFDSGSAGNLPQDTFDLDNDGNTIEPLPVDARGPGFLRDVGGSSNGIMSLDTVKAARS